MICKPCKEGATLLSLLRPDNSEEVRQQLTLRAAELHASCGNRCPCQHRGTPAERLAE